MHIVHNKQIKPHWRFWLFSMLMLFWHVIGVTTFIPETVALFHSSEQAMVSSPQIWVIILFTIYYFSGVFGSVLLIFKKHISFYFFVLSSLSIVATTIFTLSLAVSLLFLLYSGYCWKKGWLR